MKSALMVAVFGASLVSACRDELARSPRSPTTRVAPNDFADRLRAIGAASDDEADRLASAFVGLGSAALQTAASAVLYPGDAVRDRGARVVLLSIEGIDELGFLELLPPKAAHDELLACRIVDVALLLRQSVDTMPRRSGAADSKRSGARLPFVRPYADMLARIVDGTWPTCTRTCTGCETSRRRPEDEALDLLYEMTPLAEPAPVLGDAASDAREETFRRWWQRHRADLVTP